MTPEEHNALIENHTLTKQVHKAVFGNGHRGLKSRMDRAEGAIAAVVIAVTLAGVIFGIFEIVLKK